VRSGVVLVDFWAPWCAPCKIIAPTLNDIAEEYSSKITIAKVNVEKNSPHSPTHSVNRNNTNKAHCFGVRCIRDCVIVLCPELHTNKRFLVTDLFAKFPKIN